MTIVKNGEFHAEKNTFYACETMEENATLKIKVAELLQQCDLLNHELEHAKDKIEILESELYQRRAG